MMKLIAVVLVIFSQFTFEDAFQIKPRIVNGRIATAQQFPFYVYLNLTFEDGRRAACGGALLNDEFIITAAHCAFKAASMDVYFGTANLNNPHHIVRVQKENFIVYPKFFAYVAWNDICLIKLPQKVQFTPSIQSVRLPATCKMTDNTDVIAMGNGVTSADSNISRKLRFTQLKSMSINSCRYEFPIVLLRTSVICAKDKDQSASAVCFGDSGSPLVTVDGTLVGVTSFGRPEGCKAGAPQIFTRIVSYSKWIKKITGLELPKC